MRIRRRIGSIGFAMAIAAAMTTLAPETHASSAADDFGRAIVGVLAVGALGIVNVGLTIPDVAYAASGDRQPTGLAVTKIVICAPQALFYHAITVSLVADDIEPEVALLTTFGTAWTGSMTTGAIWSLANDIDSASLYGISWAIGLNSAFTAAAAAQLFGEKPMKSRTFSIVQMASMVPTLAVSAVRLTDPTATRPAWAALAGWSGLIFTHGLVTAIRAGKDPKSAQTQGKAITLPRIHVGPTLVTDGVQQVPGWQIAGMF